MSLNTITAVEFMRTSRKRKESWRTLVIVAGIKCIVIAYDLFKKGFHEVYVVVGEKLSEPNILHIPEIYIQRDSDRVENLINALTDVVH